MSVTRFCPECNNLLYPKEDRRQQILIYACGSCNHKEKADSNIVYWKQIQQPGEDESILPQDLTSEATLPRTKNVRCALCNHREAVFFQHMDNVKGYRMVPTYMGVSQSLAKSYGGSTLDLISARLAK